MTDPFLRVDDLRVSFPTEDGLVRAVDGVSFSLERGRTLAIVGESGSGKSVMSQAIMGLHNRKAADVSGQVWVGDTEVVGSTDDEVRALRGKRMAMIFQDPLSSLHPFYRIGAQLVEAVRVHQDVSAHQARELAVESLRRVGIPNAQERMDDYPHQLSGGMRQRVMIAMALINDPELLIADEPTTALDVTVQAQIIELLKDLQGQLGTAIVLITHDLGVVAQMSEDVVVMYGGRVMERGSVTDVFYRPQMPYTLGLLSSIPRLDQQRGERLEPIGGQPPSLINLPPGCVFQPRCAYSHLVPDDLCRTTPPQLVAVSSTQAVRCHLAPQTRRMLAAQRLAGGGLAGGETTAEGVRVDTAPGRTEEAS